jgi:hypothetical protein
VRIERIRIDGFGALSNLDLAWPEGRLLLVVDGNETGKTTFCEAIVSALYGLPRARSGRLRDLRRPRSGAPLRVGLDLAAEGSRWSVDRDLEAGTLRIVDRDRGVDVTKDFLRAGGRDVFGERVTGGLSEALLRSTAYVTQNVLDRDSLDAALTVELARIADSGGGEASVVRALKALEAVRREMPEATQGATVSVETEIARLTRRVEMLRTEGSRLASRRAAAAEASARFADRSGARDVARRTVALAHLAVVDAEGRALVKRREEIRAALDARRAVESEADSLSRDADVFSSQALAEIDRLREERAGRPQALEAARAALEGGTRAAAREDEERERRYGPAAFLSDEKRGRLSALLLAVIENAEEASAAENALAQQWEELQAEGLAEDFRKLDAIPPGGRAFLQGAEEERTALELQGVQLDRKSADASALVSIVIGERNYRVKLARGLVLLAAAILPVVVWFALPSTKVPIHLMASLAVFDFVLALFGGIAWMNGLRHRLQDEARAREQESANRKSAVAVRRKLSDLRLRLDRIARGAAFADASALLKAHRRARAGEEKRRALLSRTARREAAIERRNALETELNSFRDALDLTTGLPSPEETRRVLALLEDLDREMRAARTRASVRASEGERLALEAADLAALEKKLREALERVEISPSVPLPEALLIVEAGRRRAGRRKELLQFELPARREAVREEEIATLDARVEALHEETRRRLEETGAREDEIARTDTPEAARRAAEEAQAALEADETERRAAERELAAAAREGGELAREAEESLAEAEALLERATLFRDALDAAREALSNAAASVYGDFRRGLSEASRAILASWRLPYEALEFADDLSLSAIVRGGRLATKVEIEGAISTGAREQLHLTARLAALRYLGTGAEGVPLLLDDPLIGADDERFISVMRFLATEVIAERPVLLVSCLGWRHERLLQTLPASVRERLTQVSLAPFSSRLPLRPVPEAEADKGMAN